MDKKFLDKMKNAYHEYVNCYEQKDLNARLIENEQWYKMQQGRGSGKDDRIPHAKSGFLFNAILTKHADAMDNYPDITILPREECDIELAQTLTGVVPYILERNNFEKVYSDNWFSKLKTSACYCVNWDAEMDGYKGEISITKTDLLNLYWQEGISDIQDSEFVFYHSFMPMHEFKAKYGDEAYEKSEKVTQADMYYEKRYSFTNEMVLVIDAYYKLLRSDKKPILHFAKFSGDYVIFASEDEIENGKKLYPDGYYRHGLYPFFFDVMYPSEQSVAGFGLCDVLKPMQDYIDSLDSMLQVNNRIVGKPRYLVSEHMGISIDDFADLDKELINVTGSLNEEVFRKIPVDTLPSQVIESRNAKIAELKECIGNRDFQQGGTANGVTSGTALSVLQSVGDKLSRDIIKASYRCYKEIVLCVIELIRQFYSVERTIRIVGDDGGFEFARFDNSGLQGRSINGEYGIGGDSSQMLAMTDGALGMNGGALTIPPPLTRSPSLYTREAFGEVQEDLPYFDVKLSVQKSNPYSRELSNQTLLELVGSNLFNPDMFDFNLPILRALQFEGKDALLKDLSEVIEGKKQEAQAIEQLQMQISQLQSENAQLRQAIHQPSAATANGTDDTRSLQGGRFLEGSGQDMVDVTDLIEGVD